LEPIIKPWLQSKRDFVLKEDRDSRHGTGKSNIVRKWKEVNGLESYWNCPASPDLAPIENVWSMQKAYMSKFTHYEVEETRELALEAWYKGVFQDVINGLIDRMPDRFQATIDMECRMTGY
jgi:transposase